MGSYGRQANVRFELTDHMGSAARNWPRAEPRMVSNSEMGGRHTGTAIPAGERPRQVRPIDFFRGWALPDVAGTPGAARRRRPASPSPSRTRSVVVGAIGPPGLVPGWVEDGGSLAGKVPSSSKSSCTKPVSEPFSSPSGRTTSAMALAFVPSCGSTSTIGVAECSDARTRRDRFWNP